MKNVEGSAQNRVADEMSKSLVQEDSCSGISSSRRSFLRSQMSMAALAILPNVIVYPVRAFAQTDEPFGSTPVTCPGIYAGHLQGICTNDRDSIYWSFTLALVETDGDGNLLKKIDVPYHHGDLCYKDDKIYVAVNHGLFCDAQKRADSWIYVYDAHDLSFVSKHPAKEAVYGAGGMTTNGSTLLVVGGLPEGFQENYLYEYSLDFKFIRKITLKSGYTYGGIQTAAYLDGDYWFGCYGNAVSPTVTLRVNDKFSSIQKYHFDCACGIVPVSHRTFWIGRTACGRMNPPGSQVGHTECTGEVVLADIKEGVGLVLRS